MILCSQLVGPELGRDLASSELTSVKKIRKSLTLSVYRGHRRSLYAGVLLSLNRKLYKYEESLGGVMMSFDRLELVKQSHRKKHHENISVTVQVDFYVFYPVAGTFLTTTILEKQEQRATVLVNSMFPLEVSGSVGGRHPVGGDLTVKLQTVTYLSGGEPHLVGEAARGTSRQILAEQTERNIKSLLSSSDDELTGLEVRDIPGKGRGVKAIRVFKKGEPVVEYSGELINLGQSARSPKQREENDFNFYFCSGGSQFCIDASKETGRFGRLINHSIAAANIEARVVVMNRLPRLTLFAKRHQDRGGDPV